MAEVSGHYYTVGATANTLYPASGGFHDWTKGALGVKYSYVVELRDRGQYGFTLPASQIIETGQESMAFIKTIADAVCAL